MIYSDYGDEYMQKFMDETISIDFADLESKKNLNHLNIKFFLNEFFHGKVFNF